MAITIVATAGASDANSFVTVAEANAYLAARLNSSAWTGAETENEKKALVEAARELSALNWDGWRTTETQALAIPRTGMANPDATSDGEVYDDDVIPQRVKDAACELALEFLKAGTTDLAAQDSKQNVIQKTIGPISTTYSDPSARAAGLARFPRVQKLIQPLLGVGAGQVRLTR